MKISSPAFDANGIIPEKFSQNGANRSPPLDFANVPANARSLVLIMDDPDAPNGTFTHLVAFNIDANAGHFAENHIPKDVRLGRNEYDQPEYAGPKPSAGEHRYLFRLYALDCRLDLPHGAARSEVEGAMIGHIIDHAELMGRNATPVESR
jgi:Raf kinase inhibitor-like YbhB/YbcL family protein